MTDATVKRPDAWIGWTGSAGAAERERDGAPGTVMERALAALEHLVHTAIKAQ